MNKPYIICHMMMSLDGRIDCKMTEQLPGVEEYYSTLNFFWRAYTDKWTCNSRA